MQRCGSRHHISKRDIVTIQKKDGAAHRTHRWAFKIILNGPGTTGDYIMFSPMPEDLEFV